MSGRGLTNDEYDFVDLVYDDISHFLADRRGQRALLFPAVNPRRRYLIHNTVQEYFPQLTTLSVGQGDQRRTAVTFKKNHRQGSEDRDDYEEHANRVKEIADTKPQKQQSCRQQKQQQQPSAKSLGQPPSQAQSQSIVQGQSQSTIQTQSQPQSVPSQQHNSSKREEKPATERTHKENRRPEQLLYSPQRQGSQQRIDVRREAQHQAAKQQQQLNQGATQQQQKEQQSLQHTNQHSSAAPQKTKPVQQQRPSETPVSEGNSRYQRDSRSEKRDLGPAGKQNQPNQQISQQQQHRQHRHRSRSCETRSSSVHSTTPNDRVRNDDLMRDSGAEESQSSSCSNSRKRRCRRNRKQRETKVGEDNYPQNDNGHINGRHEGSEKGKKTRQSESLHNISSICEVGLTKSASGGEISEKRVGDNINNKIREEIIDNNKVPAQRASCESDTRKLQSHTANVSNNWKDNSGTNKQQNNIRSPVSSWKEEFRESGSSSPSDNQVKDSPERMPVTVPSDQGNNRRRGKAPAQIYRPPPARSSRDINLPPHQQQPQQQQPFYHQQPHQPQQQIQFHQPAYSQQYQPKPQFPQSHNNTLPHNYPSQLPPGYQHQHNYHPQQQELLHYNSLPNRQRTDSESSTATLSGDYQNNKGKGRRPDQVLYVPRGRRHVPNDPASARGTPTPLIDYESHQRPPSPAYSICSTASEFSERNRYNKHGGSRQGSQISIYEGESDRIHSKPPLSRDFSRESTPGYGRQKGNAGRFSTQTLSLIERCLNQESEHRYNEYSNYETDSVPNSPSPKNNKGGGVGGGRVQKSPTPTRDIHSIHSKENVIHPIEPGSRSRRSRKNCRRHSRSRDPSAENYNNVAKDPNAKDNGSQNGSWQNSPGEQRLGSCERIFYNSSFNSSQERYDRGYDNYDRYSSINSSRASSRNSSRERTPQHNINQNWRGGSNPPSPSKGPTVFYQSRHSPGKPPSGRLGSLPNVALDCGESPTRRLSHHNDENLRYFTLPVKSKNYVNTDPQSQTAEKNNIEYGSGCIVSDRIDANSSSDLSQSTLLENDLTNQNQNSESYNSHNNVITQNIMNSSSSSKQNEEVAVLTNQLQDCKMIKDKESESLDNSIMEKNIVNSSPEISVSLAADITEELPESHNENMNDSHSLSIDVVGDDSMNKSTDLINGTISEEEVYYDMEAEPVMSESLKESTEEVTSSDNETKDNMNKETKESIYAVEDKVKKNPKKFQFNWADEVEDSWDNLYDDDGECLDPDIKRQLSDSLGKIKLEKPANDYYSFQPKEPEINEEEYAHVIEIYDFPVSFKTQDLMMVFSTFQNTGFDIKWVDDTHALGIFATALIAAEALSVDHPFLKTRSLSLATKSSKAKAMRITEALLPYKPRPATSASLARRLVSGALGLKVNISREVREAEKQKLKVAKAQKRLAAKQRVDAWEGNLS